MADVFSRTQVNFGGAMTSEFGMITPNKGLTGLLMQQFQLQYAQAITRLYEIGNVGARINVYYVGGRAQGSLNVNHVIGPGGKILEFLTTFSDPCEAGTNDLEIKLDANVCKDTSSPPDIGGFRAKYCVIQSLSISTQAEQFVISSGVQLMFSNLEIPGFDLDSIGGQTIGDPNVGPGSGGFGGGVGGVIGGTIPPVTGGGTVGGGF